MSHSAKSLVSVLVGIGLGVFGLAFSGYRSLWERIGFPGDQHPVLDVGLSVLILLAGFLLSWYFQAEDMLDRQDGLIPALESRIPQCAAFRVLTSDEALAEIAAKLERTKAVRNTRLIARTVRPRYTTDNGNAYDASVQRALSRGIAFTDLLSEPWSQYGRDTKKRVDKGNYEFAVLREVAPSCINFIVLELASGEREVYFGWALSPARPFEQACFLSTDQRVVQFFVELHVDLMAQAVA